MNKGKKRKGRSTHAPAQRLLELSESALVARLHTLLRRGSSTYLLQQDVHG